MNELSRARDFLQALSSAARARDLYPQRHPIRGNKLDELQRAAATVLEDRGSFDLFIHEDSFFFGEKLMRRESITLQGMMRDWQKVGLRCITVTAPVRREALEALLDFLGGDGPAPAAEVSVNTAVLLAPEERPLAGAQDILRTAYAEALDLIRDIRSGLARGASPPMGPARQAVDGLVNAVLTDPESSLLITAMRSHDEATFFHMINVCILSIATGASIGLSRPQLTVLGIGGLLHDLGKIGVPLEILNRTGPLSHDDWSQIRQHPSEGAAVILRSWDKLSPLAAMIAYEHHIGVAGEGYPNVPIAPAPQLLSRIVTVADTFDAVTSRRPYRRADQRERALDILASGSGTHYDPRVVRVFIRMLGYYPPGSVVRLSDDSVAVVVRNNTDALALPVVKIVRDDKGEQVEPYEVDLKARNGRGPLIVKGLPEEAAGVDPADLA